MCIRDSVDGVAEHLAPRGLLQESFDGAVLGGDDDPELQRAVSYTHLRAHETVLDLVCRLLLEKKKSQN